MFRLKSKLRELMNSRNLSLKQLSSECGVPVQTLHNWLSGQIPKNIVQLKLVADFFEITIDELAFDKVTKVTIKGVTGIMDGDYELVLRPLKK